MFGGTGIYEGKRVGIVFRNMTFSGMGLVAKPANPHSAIVSDDGEKISGKSPTTVTALAESVYTPTHGTIHREAEMELEEAKKTIAKLEADLAKAQAANQEAAVKGLEQELAEANEKLASALAELELAKKELAVAKSLTEELTKAKASADETLAAITAERDALKADAAKLSAEKALAELTAKVKEAYKTDDEQAKAIAETLHGLPDEKVAGHLATVAALKAVPVAGTPAKPVATINLGGAKAEEETVPLVTEPAKASADAELEAVMAEVRAHLITKRQ